MAAFLRKLLILDLDRGDAGLLIAAHSVADIEQTAVAGIGIGNDRRLGHFRNAPDAIDHLRIAGKARVRQAQRGRNRAVARHIQGFETHAIGNEGGDQFENAWRRDEAAVLDFLPQRWRGHELFPSLQNLSGQQIYASMVRRFKTMQARARADLVTRPLPPPHPPRWEG